MQEIKQQPFNLTEIKQQPFNSQKGVYNPYCELKLKGCCDSLTICETI